MINGPSFEIIIPQTVLGESVAKILQKVDPADAVRVLGRLAILVQRYNIRPGTCLTPPGKDALEIAGDLKRLDERLDGTDIIIAAHALSDPDAKFFLTHDKRLLKNATIERYEKEMRDDGRRNKKLEIKEEI